MFKRYNEGARRVIFFARYEASQLGSHEITPEHIMLALFREDRRLTTQFLTVTQMDDMRREIELKCRMGEMVATSADLPLSSASKRILAYAAEEAEARKSEHIGTAHLFIGLLVERNTIAADLLRAHGLDLKAVRSALLTDVHVRPEPGESFSGSFIDVEIFCGKDKLAEASLLAVPRISEHLVLGEKQRKRYRVVDVIYELEAPPSITSVFPNGMRTLILQVEPA